MPEESFCVRCKEEFPIGETWAMGQLRRLRDAPRWIQQRFSEWLSKDSFVQHPMLCGNCYFDLLDERS